MILFLSKEDGQNGAQKILPDVLNDMAIMEIQWNLHGNFISGRKSASNRTGGDMKKL